MFILVIILLILIYKLLNNDYDEIEDFEGCDQPEDIISEYKKRLHINENERMIIMNAVPDKLNISFSHHYQLFQLLKQLIEYMDSNEITYFITGGLLIGLDRHNNSFIPWDDDIDICIFEKDEHKFKNYPRKIDIIKYTKNGNYVNDDDIFIDIFVLDNHTLEYKYEIHRNFWVNDSYKNIVFPLMKKEFVLYLPDGKIYDKIDIYVPNKYTEYLEKSYGKDYMKTHKIGQTHSKFYNCIYY
jgi:phosphorylcholine metabolism protein LicD